MSTVSPWYITTFYRFIPLQNLQEISQEWQTKAEELGIIGLVILGDEGFNTTCSAANPESLQAFKDWVTAKYDCAGMMFKDSFSDQVPFPRFKVKIRDEIVTLNAPDLVPNGNHRHLSPDKWNEALQDPNVVVLDTRNWYETRIGTFKQAIDPKIEQFTEFPEFVENQNYSKDQKMLIFCTGGIRCEKAILDLERRGYNNVHQLEGGILNYLEKFPNDQFEGECFVFDNRVAVDQNLAPSRQYKLCPHCGQPADVKITCERCDTEAVICVKCREEEVASKVCSKNCAHHMRLRPGHKGRRQEPGWNRTGRLSLLLFFAFFFSMMSVRPAMAAHGELKIISCEVLSENFSGLQLQLAVEPSGQLVARYAFRGGPFFDSPHLYVQETTTIPNAVIPMLTKLNEYRFTGVSPEKVKKFQNIFVEGNDRYDIELWKMMDESEELLGWVVYAYSGLRGCYPIQN